MSCCAGQKDGCGGPKNPSSGNLDPEKRISSVQEFYTEKQSSTDLGSSAPCSASCPLDVGYPKIVSEALDLVHQDVKNSYFGCGMPFPNAVEGARILDLGSGTGRDCFLLSYLVGKEGAVVGVDMTPAMLKKSTDMIPYHAEKFGFNNVKFVRGTLENLDKVEELEPNSFDIIISNCVINLSQDKRTVFKHAYNLLKPGGELCFSDVYTMKPLPDELINHELAWNECFTGALVWTEFQKMTKDIGFIGPIVLDSKPYYAVTDELKKLLEGHTFKSNTCRLFKPSEISSSDLEGSATYTGNIAGSEKSLTFSDSTTFKVGLGTNVSAEVLAALKCSRFAKHFKFGT